MLKKSVVLSILILVMGLAVIADAQTETTTSTTYQDAESALELRAAVVITTYGNHVVVENQDGEVVDFAVADDFRFNIDGRQLRVDQLEPGTLITAIVKTTTTAQKVVTTTVREGKVMHVQGRTVIVRAPEGMKKVVVPKDFVFYVNGEEKTVDQLRKGMSVTAVIVSESSPVTLSERELASEIVGTAPARAAQPAAAPAPMAAQLPKTGSRLPLVGLLGLVALLAGAGMATIRRW